MKNLVICFCTLENMSHVFHCRAVYLRWLVFGTMGQVYAYHQASSCPICSPNSPECYRSLTTSKSTANWHQSKKHKGYPTRLSSLFRKKYIHKRAIILLCHRIWFLDRQDTSRDYRIQLIVRNDYKRVLCRKVLLCNLVGNKLSAYHLHNAD